MYYYIVNPNAGNGTFVDIQHKLKSTLHGLGIDGEFAKTLQQKDARTITQSALQRGMKTIVVAGGDKTVNEVVAAVQESGKQSISIGIIPLGNHNTLATYLGITDWRHACHVLAARRLQSFNLVHINDHSFIHSCHIEPKSTSDTSQLLAEIDGSHKLRGEVAFSRVSNQKLHNVHLPNQLLLRLYPHRNRSPWWSRIFGSAGNLSSPAQLHARVAILEFSSEHTATIDGRTLHNTLFRIRLSETPLQLIAARSEQPDLDPEHG